MAKVQTRIFTTDYELGLAAATEIFSGVKNALAQSRNYVLGCPGGRSPRSTYRALAKIVSTEQISLEHLYIAMMDEYVLQQSDNEYRNVNPESHFSCRGFAMHEIREILNTGLAPDKHLPYEHILVPDAKNPAAYEDQMQSLQVDCFLLASGASDGHVAFNGRGTEGSATTRITALAEETRRDNMHTFPAFNSLSEVPTFGVTVGPGTIAKCSKSAIMLLQGEHKQEAFRRINSAQQYEIDWPATIVTECENPQIFADSLAASSS